MHVSVKKLRAHRAMCFQEDLSLFGKDHLTTSLIPDGNFVIKPVALSVTGNGNCLFNSVSLVF